jgi:hypothetical protein
MQKEEIHNPSLVAPAQIQSFVPNYRCMAPIFFPGRQNAQMCQQKVNPCRLARPQKSPSLVPAASHVTGGSDQGHGRSVLIPSTCPCRWSPSSSPPWPILLAPAKPALHADESSFDLHP